MSLVRRIGPEPRGRSRPRDVIPAAAAGCSMADMATANQVNEAWKIFEKLGIAKKTIPITYEKEILKEELPAIKKINRSVIYFDNINAGTINLQNVNVQTGSSGARLQIDSTGIKAYNSSNINTVSIGSDGTASFTGTIAASNGTIGGWNIGTPPGSASGYAGSVYAQNGSDLSLMSPTGLAWFSSGVVTSQINGFGTGVTTNGGSLGSAFLRNISYGSINSRPSSPKTGDIHFS